MTSFEKFCGRLITAHFVVFSLMSFISVSALSLTHIFLVIPAIYFTREYIKKFAIPRSAMFLCLFVIFGLIGTFVNLYHLEDPFKVFTSYKYFIFGFLSIAPYHFWLTRFIEKSKLKNFILALLITTTFAHLVGLISLYLGYNPVKGKAVNQTRSMGMFGNIMTYGYQSAWYVILLFGMVTGKLFPNLKFKNRLVEIALVIGFIGTWASFARGAIIGMVAAFGYFLFFIFRESKILTIKLALSFFFIFGGLLLVPHFFAKEKIDLPKVKPYYYDRCHQDDGIVRILRGQLISSVKNYTPIPSRNRKNGDRLIQKIDSHSNLMRVSQFKAAIGLIKKNPWFGVGLKEFATKAVDYKKKNKIPFASFKSHAHNNFLEIFATTGALAGACFVMWIFFWFWEMWKAQTSWSIIIGMVIISFVISGLVQCTITDGENAFFLFAVYALSTAMTLKRKSYADAVR
jgi:O-antigen ligase